MGYLEPRRKCQVRRLTPRAIWHDILSAQTMEFPEPYHSLPISEWRQYMKAHPRSYATLCVRQWIRNRRKWILVCHGEVKYTARANRSSS
jgi:hypothetical protein